MGKELGIEKKLKEVVENDCKGLCIKLLPWVFTGLPDRMCLFPGGIVIFVETKSPGKDLSPRQKWVKNKFVSLGFAYFKLDCKEDISKIIDQVNLIR